MSQITRKTKVVSVSLNPKTLKDLDSLCELTCQNRSSAVSGLIKKASWTKQWEKLRTYGRQTAGKFNLTSEEDVYKFLGDA